jgi:mannan endo-1,4-beta-mannosidase
VNKKPVNPTVSAEACALLRYFYSIKGKQTLSAQHDFISSGTKYCDRIKELTGRRPSIWGSDLSFCFTGSDPKSHKHCGPMNLIDPGLAVTASDLQFAACDMSVEFPNDLPEKTPDEIMVAGVTPHAMRQALVERIKEQHAKGHIITLMWHTLVPGNGDCGPYEQLWMSGGLLKTQWEELITPGTVLHTKWLAEVDTIAVYLKQLCDAGIPVLWRPYHEMNGVWFWWCNQPGPRGYRQLWIQLYERLAVHHGLNNLLWVWNAHAPRDWKNDEAYAYADFYPDEKYVDILATDIYRRDYKQSHYDDLIVLANGKPVALAEVGELPPDEVLDRQPWAWVMPWGHLFFLCNTKAEIKAFYHRSDVISL